MAILFDHFTTTFSFRIWILMQPNFIFVRSIAGIYSDHIIHFPILATKDARTVLTNQDPTKKHLVVVFESQTDGIDVHVTLHVHDLNTMQPVKSFSIKNFYKSRHVYSDPNVVFRGNFIYALQSEAKVLHIFNLNESAHDVADQIQLDIESTMATLFGVHKSLVFGYCRGNEHSSQRFPWLYDLKAKQLRYYPENLVGASQTNEGDI